MSRIIFNKDTKNENKPSFVFDDPKSNLREIMRRYDRQTSLIIGVLVVSLAIMIIMTGTLIIDSFHINSVTYKEYSSKIDLQNKSLEVNRQMIDEIQQNQIIIKNFFNKINK